MKKILLTITIAFTTLLFASVANAQSITTGNAGASTTVINCVNQTNSNNCPPNNNPGPTPPPPGNPGGNPGGGSGGSGGGGGTFVCTLGAPAGTATLISVVKVSPNSVKLTWTSASGADGYSIEYGTQSGKYTFGVPNTGNVTSYVIGSLDLSKPYFFRVIALNGCAHGNASNEVSTAFGGAVLGLSNTNSSDNSIALLALAMVLGGAGAALLFVGIKKS